MAPELTNTYRTIKNENQARSENCFFNSAMRLSWQYKDVQEVFAVALRSARSIWCERGRKQLRNGGLRLGSKG